MLVTSYFHALYFFMHIAYYVRDRGVYLGLVGLANEPSRGGGHGPPENLKFKTSKSLENRLFLSIQIKLIKFFIISAKLLVGYSPPSSIAPRSLYVKYMYILHTVHAMELLHTTYHILHNLVLHDTYYILHNDTTYLYYILYATHLHITCYILYKLEDPLSEAHLY